MARQPLPNDGLANTPAFTGLRNTLRPERLPYGALAVAENVICDDTGTLEIRPGYERVISLSNATDMFAPLSGEFMLLVQGGNLLSISDGGLAPVTLAAGLTDSFFQWAETTGDRVYYAGATDAGVVMNGKIALPLRYQAPPQPKVVAMSGYLPPGQYLIRAVYRNDMTGMESPASKLLVANLSATGSLHIEMPSQTGYWTDLYVSSTNGRVPYACGSVFEGGVIVVNGIGRNARPLAYEQRDTYPMPSGITALAYHAACLYAATYDQRNDLGTIWFSWPDQHQFFRLRKDFFTVPGKVLGLCSTTQGILIGTTKQILLQSLDNVITRLAQYGVVEGRPFSQDEEGLTGIWTQRGPATFDTSYKDLAEGKVSVPCGDRCVTQIIELHGMKQFFVLTDSGQFAFNPY
jgi:hypothetical protein